MTITPKSNKREISDLQRMLLSLGLMRFTDQTQSGKWGDETQDAVVALYDQLGWDHADDGKWITAPALAAMTGLYAARHADSRVAGSHAGGAGSHAGGAGSHAGGAGSHAGGAGSHAGGAGSHAGGAGSHAGGAGSHAGGAGSHAGGAGSHAG